MAAPNNPYGLDRTPGGSSGGAGAIIAAGGSPFDIGSDTGGSVPAARALQRHRRHQAQLRQSSSNRTHHPIRRGRGGRIHAETAPWRDTWKTWRLFCRLSQAPTGKIPRSCPCRLATPPMSPLGDLRVAFLHQRSGVRGAGAGDDRRDACSRERRLGHRCVSRGNRPPAPLSRVPELKQANRRRRWPRHDAQDIGEGWHNRNCRHSSGRYGIGQPLSRLGSFSGALEELDQYRSDMLSFMRSYDAIICPTAAMPAPRSRRDFRAREPQRILHRPLQPHGLARSGHQMRRFVGGASHRRPDHSPSLARGCGASDSPPRWSRRSAATSSPACDTITPTRHTEDQHMAAADIIYRSAKSTAQSIRNGEVSAVEVAQAHLDRIGEVNGRLNAVVMLCAGSAPSTRPEPPTQPYRAAMI